MKQPHLSPRNTTIAAWITGSILLFLAIGAAWGDARAHPANSPFDQISPLHPTFPLLDEKGDNVLDSGEPASTMATCGSCHDAQFISEHSFHSDVGLSSFDEPGVNPELRVWDSSTGFFGRWNPIPYRYLSPQGDERIDLSTPAWIKMYGARHAGGGPAVTSRSGEPLKELEYQPGDPDTNILDETSGELVAWDWDKSGVVEMNCFLCHTAHPDNDARIEALQAGNFGWANSATLISSGVISKTGESYTWNQSAFQENGELKTEFVSIQDPTNDNCGVCHGLVHEELEEPLTHPGCSPETWRTVTTGQIVSPQRLSDTGMNLENKNDLSRSWDIHAERLLKCTDCHYSLNNPVYFEEKDDSRPDHLTFDPRRLDLGEYLYRPLHQFARGSSANSQLEPELKDTMRRCESCHSIEATHDWLPYKERHMEQVSCETCHIPQMYSTAYKQYDWTSVSPEGLAQTRCRGVEGKPDDPQRLITGFEPALLSSQDADGSFQIAPYNLVTSWYWIYDDPPRPVRLQDLKAAFLEGDSYHPDVILQFDQDDDGQLTDEERIIDTPEKEAFISGRLAALGVENPRITGEVQPYSINHTVTSGEWALKDCSSCHNDTSRITQPIELAEYLPGGVVPQFVNNENVIINGEIYFGEDSRLYYRPATKQSGLYVLGHDNVDWVDRFGGIIFAGTLLGILAHASFRFVSTRRNPPHAAEYQEIYMYSTYERLWHWLQTFVIVGLLFTGLTIHKPDIFGIFSFRGVVIVHNLLAAILVANAALSLFYHLASGEIKQFLPRPRGFFDDAILQAKYYLRGIFKGEGHPFEKTAKKKLNPLQQVTYLMILNVLLPLQILTGALMWGAQRWPAAAGLLGGLPYLAPFHTLIAWLFASFIVLHVYLTTTGPQPLTSLKAMMNGWDEVETVTPSVEATD